MKAGKDEKPGYPWPQAGWQLVGLPQNLKSGVILTGLRDPPGGGGWPASLDLENKETQIQKFRMGIRHFHHLMKSRLWEFGIAAI